MREITYLMSTLILHFKVMILIDDLPPSNFHSLKSNQNCEQDTGYALLFSSRII